MVLVALNSAAQVRPAAPAEKQPAATNFSIGGGITRSVLFLSRNIKDDNDATGFNINVTRRLTRLIRLGAEYTFYRSIDVQPTWYTIKASTLELNLHFIARLTGSKAVFYPLFGLSYNAFNGFFTGKNDFNHLSRMYPVNSTVHTRWLGLNVGTGYEHYFRPLSVFVEYKMRAGVSDEQRQFNVIDVCFSAGIRFNARVRPFISPIKGPRARYNRRNRR
jgi:hypothetical protein